MGRPIAKSYFVGSSFPGAGDLGTLKKIAVSAYRSGGSTTTSSTAYIVNQRGSNRFKIHLDDSTEAVYTLKAVAPGSLTDNGTFCVQGTLDDSTVVYISRFYKRTVHYVTSGGATGSAPINNVITSGVGYQLNTTEGDDQTKLSGHVTIDSI